MPKHDRITIANGTQEWHGRTRRDAEAARDQQLDRLFACYSAPPILILRGAKVRAVVWQEHSGWWTYSIVWPDAKLTGPNGDAFVARVTISAEWSMVTAEHRCRRHLAQVVYDEEGRAASLSVIRHEDEEGYREHVGWMRAVEEEKARRAAPGWTSVDTSVGEK